MPDPRERAPRRGRAQRAAGGGHGSVSLDRSEDVRRHQQGRERRGEREGSTRARQDDARGPHLHGDTRQRRDDPQGSGHGAQVHASRDARGRLPSHPPAGRGGADAGARRRRARGAHREDTLFDLDRRDSSTSQLRALRVGWRHRAYGDYRRAPPFQDGGQGFRAAGFGDDAHPAEGHPRAPPHVRRPRCRHGQGREGRASRSSRLRRAARARSSRAAARRSA